MFVILYEFPSPAQPQQKTTTPLSPPSQGGDEGEVKNQIFPISPSQGGDEGEVKNQILPIFPSEEGDERGGEKTYKKGSFYRVNYKPVYKTMQDSVLKAMLDLWGQAKELHSIPITGCSMLPLIRSGDHVLVMHGCTDVRCGDVVVFRYKEKLIAHRVLQIYKGASGLTFITKGDNAPQCDPPLSSNQIIGRVLAITRGSRQISLRGILWRVMGWMIVITTLTRIKFQTRGRYLIQKLSFHLPTNLVVFLRRSEKYFFFLIRKFFSNL